MAKQPRISISEQADYTARMWATHTKTSTSSLVSRLIISNAPDWIKDAWLSREGVILEAEKQIPSKSQRRKLTPELIEEIREAKAQDPNLTLQQLADLFGLSKSTVSRWIKGIK